MRDPLSLSPPGDVSRETSERLHVLADLLVRWNPTINLVAASTIAHMWPRHIADSLRLAPYLRRLDNLADLGSGAGFPGLVLSIACDIPVLLIEADHRKASFLRQAIRLTGSSARVHVGRVEEYAGETFGTLTARAFLPLNRLMSISRHLLAPGGRYLLLKGADALNEVDRARRANRFAVTAHRSRPPFAGYILEITPDTDTVE